MKGKKAFSPKSNWSSKASVLTNWQFCDGLQSCGDSPLLSVHPWGPWKHRLWPHHILPHFVLSSHQPNIQAGQWHIIKSWGLQPKPDDGNLPGPSKLSSVLNTKGKIKSINGSFCEDPGAWGGWIVVQATPEIILYILNRAPRQQCLDYTRFTDNQCPFILSLGVVKTIINK